MAHGPLVSCETLFEHLEDPVWRVMDCRHALGEPGYGPERFEAAHIPGAVHAHVDHDLSDPVGDRSRGRHPLPDPGRFAAWLGLQGITPDTQVVAYDEGPGMWASRMWWLLQDRGHDAVAVLDGGFARWQALRLPMESGSGATRPKEGAYPMAPGQLPRIDADGLWAQRDRRDLVDVRSPERYRGEAEPIDPVAGHIPGARNMPLTDNIGPDGLWLSPDELRARYEHLRDPVVYCGSGVTATHAVLATQLAGLEPASIYPGSWSAWCRPEAGRPIERG